MVTSSRLEGRLAVVTGAARGLGAGIAQRLAGDGAHVMCADRVPAETTVESIRKDGGTAEAVLLDVTDAAQVERVFAGLAEQFGPLRILVNNAGVAHEVQHLLDTPEEVLHRVFAVNVFGLLACARAAARLMIAAGVGGRIVNMASQAGKSPWPGWGAYCASKACVINLTQCLALELADHDIYVNAVCPGTMMTDMTRTGFSHGLSEGETLESALAAKAATIPMRRLGNAEDVGGLIAWLASDDASFTTGAAINLTGGESVFF